MVATYVMDGDRPLTAESAGNTTFYLYGLGAIGEKTTAWSYSLPDGTNTPRQLTDIQGDITLSARYTPWGDSLELHGTGQKFSFGYFGGVLDATTGLLYVGNGQYYTCTALRSVQCRCDPATGRFLTRGVNPNSTNPYVPWNPIGAIVGPLGLIALVFGRRKKGSKAAQFLVLLLVLGSVGMTIASCSPPPNAPAPGTNQPPPSPAPTQTPVPTGPVTYPTDTPTTTPSPVVTPTLTPCATPNYPQPGTTPVPNSPGFYSYGIGSRFYQIFAQTPGGWWDKFVDPNAGLWPIVISMAFHWETWTLNDPVFKDAMKEAFSRKLWDSYRLYGQDGWSYYLGGRDPVRIRVDRLSAHIGNANALTDALKTVEGMDEDIAQRTYDKYGKDIWNNAAWQTGYDWNSPFEFGNPTDRSPEKFLGALKGDLPACNGHCIDQNSVYYRNGKLNVNDFHYQGEVKVYHLAVVMTPAQIDNLCGGASCVKP